jgi:hypothetical protein
MYFFPDKIVNMNLTYLSPDDKPANIEALKLYLSDVLGRDLSDDTTITISIKKQSSSQ